MAKFWQYDANGIKELADVPSGQTPTWGVIDGTLSDQVDLQTSLDGKSLTSHNHNLADLTEKSYNSLTNKPTLGNSSSKDVGTGSGDVAAGNHTHAGGSEAFPVGSVFIAVVSTNPATLLGYGTWSAIAAGKMLVGLDSGDTDFDTVEETGGAKTKTIAQANLPDISTGAGTAHNHGVTDSGHTHLTQRYPTATGASSGFTIDTSMSGTLADNTLPTKSNTTGISINNESAHTHSLGGSGTALNVVNPYFVVYMWKRTA